MTARTVGLIANDVLGRNMAGPAIRYWELARVLQGPFNVKLIAPPYLHQEPVPESAAPLHICESSQELNRLARTCDVIITLGSVLSLYPFLRRLGIPLVFDLYDPYLLSTLHRDGVENLNADERRRNHESYLEGLMLQLRFGDFFLCAGERQRDYCLGLLSAAGRISPMTYGHDPTLKALIDEVPFGIPGKSPTHTANVLKGCYKTIGREDRVILWAGGIWDWLDAQTLIKAMPLVLEQQPRTRLFFMGTERPNSSIPRMRAVNEAVSFSKKLGLYDRAVFFHSWVPYEERHNYLLEADIGVSLHLDHAESRLAFRSRLLDYLWGGVPTVCTRGDLMGDTLEKHGLAHLVEPGDVAGVAQGILRILEDPGFRSRQRVQFEKLASVYRWERVAQPLIRFCANPYVALDKEYLGVLGGRGRWRRLLQKARQLSRA